MYNFSQRSKDKLKGVHPDLVRVMEEAIRTSPIDFAIIQGVRTQAEQNALYEQGRTKPGQIVTWTRDSKHIPQKDGYGHAVDFAAFVDGKISWDEKYYPPIIKVILNAAKELGVKVTSGSQWKRVDLPHIQIEVEE